MKWCDGKFHLERFRNERNREYKLIFIAWYRSLMFKCIRLTTSTIFRHLKHLNIPINIRISTCRNHILLLIEKPFGLRENQNTLEIERNLFIWTWLWCFKFLRKTLFFLRLFVGIDFNPFSDALQNRFILRKAMNKIQIYKHYKRNVNLFLYVVYCLFRFCGSL